MTFHEMQAEVTQARANSGMRPCDIYLVAAWDTGGGGWSIRRQTNSQEYLTLEAAEKAASELNGRWIHRTIVKMSLGAENQLPCP